MNIHDIRMAKQQAEREIRAVDNVVAEMAYLCAGRLKVSGVSWDVLNRLKVELKNFNMHTGSWKDE